MRGGAGRGGVKRVKTDQGAGSRAPRDLSLADAQAAVHAWISRFEEGYWPPLANLARLTEEVGELARELNHRHGAKPRKPGEPDGNLALELADILFVLLVLANQHDIDLGDALRKVLHKYEIRDADRWTPRHDDG